MNSVPAPVSESVPPLLLNVITAPVITAWLPLVLVIVPVLVLVSEPDPARLISVLSDVWKLIVPLLVSAVPLFSPSELLEVRFIVIVPALFTASPENCLLVPVTFSVWPEETASVGVVPVPWRLPVPLQFMPPASV